MFVELEDSGVYVNTRALSFATQTRIGFVSGDVLKLQGDDYRRLVAAIETEQHKNAVFRGKCSFERV